jgi:anoctamin-10/anoctamin-7
LLLHNLKVGLLAAMPIVQRSNNSAYVDEPGQQMQAAQQMVVPAARMPRADMCLVFPYKTSALVKYGDSQQFDEEGYRGLKPPTPEQKHKMDMWTQKRKAVITALSDCGLILMLYYSRDRDEIFVKLSVEDRHLRQVAEMKRHKLELKEEYLSAFAEYKDDYTGQRELNYSDRIVVSHLYKAHVDDTGDDGGEYYPRPNAIFRSTDRIALIDYIVRAADHQCAGVDVGQMIHDGDLAAFYPLHENRQLAYMDKNWFPCFVWGNQIHKVRDYFGERIALYFLFMSHFIKWLIFPSICGTAIYVGGVFYGTPDNLSALLVCISVSLWYVFFVHFWRRNEATHAVKWGSLSIGPTLEPTRPGFTGTSRINPVTGRIDRYYPWSQRIFTVLTSYAVLTVSIIGLAFIIACLFVLRRIFHAHGGRQTFMVINAIVVEILNTGFTWIAKKLTIWENYRTQSEHANHLLAKTIIFKFINCYISLYYIAFFKQHSHLFGVEMQCMYNPRTEQNDCLEDLGWQLAIFIVIRLTLQNAIELGMPYFVMWYRKFTEGTQFHSFSLGGMFSNPLTVMADMSSAEKQSKKEDYDLYEDMDEILLLYGYSTLFIVAAPWVPMLCLISCIVEVFLDQKKLILLYRRPLPQPAANNEPWDTAFDVFGFLAVLTNAAVFIFAGHTFDSWTHSKKIALFLTIEFSTIFLRMFISLVLPPIPRRVRLLQLQQDVMVHRHMDLGGEEDDHETRASAMRTTVQPPPYVFDKDQEDDELW